MKNCTKKLNFEPKRVSRTSTIILNAPLETVFPLFGPIKEMEWAHGWNPEIIYSETGDMEEHMVFKTRSYTGEPDYTWIVSKYLPDDSLIEYTVFTLERIWYITIKSREKTAETTETEVTYTYTGLSKRGNKTNERALHLMYSNNLKDWEEAINHYLETGKRLTHHH